MESHALSGWATSLAGEAGIKPYIWNEFLMTMEKLGDHTGEHFDHCMRVGIYAYRLARDEGQTDLHYPLFAGCGHDIGKCEIDRGILDAKNWDDFKMDVVKAHTHAGYKMLADKFFFTALVAGLHHKFQPNGYGIDWDTVEDDGYPVSASIRARAEAMAKFIMICDFFDAITTRDGKFNGSSLEIMHRFFEGQEARINWLFANQIP